MSSPLADLAESVGAIFGAEGVVDDLKDIALVGGSAVAGIAAMQFAFAKVPWVSTQTPNMKAGISIAAGAALGILLGRYVNKGVGLGVATGLVANGLGTFVYPWVASTLGLKGFADLSAPGDELLLGLSNISARDRTAIPGQVNGLAQLSAHGPVGIRDVSPIPGSADLGSWLS